MDRKITKKIDSVVNIPDEYRKEIIPAPVACKIELTARCNHKCDYCAHSMHLRHHGNMDRHFYERIIVEMFQEGVRELGLFYIGESFLVSWLPDAIRYAKRVGYKYIFLTTNGVLAFPDAVRACMDAGLNSLKFSYNYCNADEYARITGCRRELWGRIISNIQKAREIRDAGNYDCGLYASYIKYTGEQEKFMELALDRIRESVDETYALPLYNMATSDKKRQQALGKGWVPVGGNTGRADAPVKPLPCWTLFREAHITWDGKLSACCFESEDKFDMGDLNQISFMDGWNSAKFQELRRNHLKENILGTECEGCIVYEQQD